MVYIVSAFVCSRFLSILASEEVQAYLPTTGLSIQITDEVRFRAWVTGILLVAGEFVYHFVHKKFILPKVSIPKEKEKSE